MRTWSVLILLSSSACQPSIVSTGQTRFPQGEYRGTSECTTTVVIPDAGGETYDAETAIYVDAQGHLTNRLGVRYEVGGGITLAGAQITINAIDTIGDRTIMQASGTIDDSTGFYLIAATASYTRTDGGLQYETAEQVSSERSTLNPEDAQPFVSGGPYLLTTTCSGLLAPQ